MKPTRVPFLVLCVCLAVVLPTACGNGDGPPGDGDGVTGDGDGDGVPGDGDGDGDGVTGDGDGDGDGDNSPGGTSGDGDTGDGDGDGDDTGDGDGDAGGDGDGTCEPAGISCEEGSDCCSGQCNPMTGTCAQVLGTCAQEETPCNSDTECCSLRCQEGACSADACVMDLETCGESSECCSGNCKDEQCVPANVDTGFQCATAGNACDNGAECCSNLCNLDAGTCLLGASYCVQPGDVCDSDAQCCGGVCVMGEGELGYCGLLPQGGTDCGGERNNGLLAGSVCGGQDDCDSCCSRTCAPYGPSGLSVCQPAGGCRISGELCREDSDCCGGADEGTLPGAGGALCLKQNASDPVGKCKYVGCAPHGALCAPDDVSGLACGVAPPVKDGQSCCGKNAVVGDPCSPDDLLIPRCDVLAECVPNGGECGTSNDCCNGLPCIQNQDGIFACYEPPGGTCVESGGPCSSSADCCAGSMCLMDLGAGSGVCGRTELEPPGTGGTSGDGDGDGDGSGGTPGDGDGDGSGGTSGDGDGDGSEICAAFGQDCSVFDCCNNVPCDPASNICRFSSGG